MKSAYASFQAPPWWPFFAGATRLTTIARSLLLLIGRSASLRLHAAHMFFEPENDGRSVENSTLRPNSTAIAGA